MQNYKELYNPNWAYKYKPFLTMYDTSAYGLLKVKRHGARQGYTAICGGTIF